MTWLRSFSQRYPWFWRNAPYAVMTGVILALVLLAALPQSVCLGECTQRDKWCNGNCTQECHSSTRVQKIIGCHFASTAACGEDVEYHNLLCPNGDNCLTDPYPWQVNRCDEEYNDQGILIACHLVADYAHPTCCGAPSGGGGGGCTPDYAPPTIHADEAAFSPPYPLTLGQDPDHLGVTVTVTAEGGEDNNNCGGGKAKITDFKVTSIDLAESSRDWILYDLAVWYPGAHIKGLYPTTPDQSTLQGQGTPQATLWFHFDTPDPGYYEVTVVATQDKGNKTSTATILVPVHLLETTIVR